MGLAFGYNTNGFAHHRLEDCLALLAELGYDGVALTLDVHHLDPTRASAREVEAVRRRLDALGLRRVVETGARYVLDPRRKHEPSLLSQDWRRRLVFTRRCIEIAADLGAPVVTLHSGRLPAGTPPGEGEARLRAAVESLLAHADERGVTLAFEPEPGMAVATLADFDRLRAETSAALQLTLDVGHVLCSEAMAPAQAIARYAPVLANVHIEDARRDAHVHLPFGEGELDVEAVIEALAAADYRGLVNVELSRNSHDAPLQAERSLRRLRRCAAALSGGT